MSQTYNLLITWYPPKWGMRQAANIISAWICRLTFTYPNRLSLWLTWVCLFLRVPAFVSSFFKGKPKGTHTHTHPFGGVPWTNTRPNAPWTSPSPFSPQRQTPERSHAASLPPARWAQSNGGRIWVWNLYICSIPGATSWSHTRNNDHTGGFFSCWCHVKSKQATRGKDNTCPAPKNSMG